MSTIRSIRPGLAFSAAVSLSQLALADTINVPGDFSSIQAAIDAAADGDEVIVATGTYSESINFQGKGITVRSTDPLDFLVVDATIIDGNGLNTVVTLSAGTISGFTIQNGFGPGTTAGGVEATGTAVVSWNVVTGNTAEQRGGGVSATDAAIVHNNRIIANTAVNRAGGVNARDEAVIIDNFIADNAATSGGGGISTRGTPLIRNNTLVGNNSAETGGGVLGGGGILADESPTIINNIIVFGTDGTGLHVPDGATPIWDYNCVFGNLEGDYGGIGRPAANDVNADPLLNVDNVHLTDGSPCVDGGDPRTELADGESDIDGESRLINGRVDIGADEFGGAKECLGDANQDNVVDPLDSGYVLSRLGCSVGAGDPLCDAADVNEDGVVDPLDSGFVLARFGNCP